MFMTIACLAMTAAACAPPVRGQKPRSGAQLFNIYCSKCHTTAREYSLGPSLRHVLRPGRLKELQFRDVVMNGRNTMPKFDRRLTTKDLDRLVAYLKTK